MVSMELKDYLGIIPEQYTGKKIITTTSVTLNDREQTVVCYNEAKKRLLNVNEWHSIAGFVSGHFYVVNRNGEELNRLVEKGDYFKIDIPGPGSSEGDGYDWVHVEELQEISTDNVQSTGFRVRPSQNPEGEKSETAHFYTSEATSTFIVTQKKNQVTVQILDLNLIPNDETNSVTDKIRNVAVGVGAIGLFSKVQWKNLADGILNTGKH